jgi:hypothetical protein
MNKEIEARRASVERLLNEGKKSEEIADILDVPGRTIRHDIEVIRAAIAIDRDEKTVAGQVIRLIARAEGRMGRLTKVADAKDCPYQTKVDAEWKAWQVARELAQELRAMGYLPNAAKEVNAHLTHHVTRQATADETRAKIAEFERAMKEVGFENEAARKQLEAIKGELAK